MYTHKFLRCPTCFYLVGGLNPSDNMKVSWDYYSQYMENKTCSSHHQPENIITIHGLSILFISKYGNKKCSKPPTRDKMDHAHGDLE